MRAVIQGWRRTHKRLHVLFCGGCQGGIFRGHLNDFEGFECSEGGYSTGRM